MRLSMEIGRPRSLVLALLAVACMGSARADRVLQFGARERAEGAVRIGEVTGGGQVLIRLRSKTGSPLDRAQTAAEALQAASLAGFARPTLTVGVGPEGTAVLKADGQVVVTADKETAQLASSTPGALATSWQEAIYRALEEPYLALQSNERLQVPVGEARYVGFGGPLGKKLTVASNDEGVALVKLEAPNRRFKAYGADVGDTALGLKAGSVAVGLAVQVRHWAASIPDSTEAALTGSGQDERIALKVAVNAALSAVEPRPGALVSVNSTERTGAVFRIGVLASGEGYFDAKKRIEVQLKWLSPPSMEPADLMVSNSPERIYSLGCLMREPLSPDRAARLLYHHVNSTGQPILFVARIANAGPEAAAAHVILAESGPGRDELGVGHAAAARFWEASRTGSGYVLRIPAMTASDIVRTPASPETVLSGLAAIAPLTASSLFVEVSALPVHDEAEWVEPLASEEYTQPKLTTFRFAAKKTTELIHEVGGAWTFFSLGREGSTNEAGTHLSGDYGVLHEINLRITNPHDEPGWAALEVRASGGLMRGLFLIDGQLHETGILAGTQQERLFRQDIPPGTTRNVRIQTIPESASNYPVHLVVHSGLTG